MLRLIPAFLVISATILPAHGQQTPGPKPLSVAIAAADGRDWDVAARLATRAGGAVAEDIVEWMRLRAREGTVGEAMDFLARQPVGSLRVTDPENRDVLFNHGFVEQCGF